MSPSHRDCLPSLTADCMRLTGSSVTNRGDVQDAAACPTVLLPNPMPPCTLGKQRKPTDSLSAALMNCWDPATITAARTSSSWDDLTVCLVANDHPTSDSVVTSLGYQRAATLGKLFTEAHGCEQTAQGFHLTAR